MGILSWLKPKSKMQKDAERRIKMNQALIKLQRQVKELEKQAGRYGALARRAFSDGLLEEYELSKRYLRQTLLQRKLASKMSLTFEISMHRQAQIESYASFATGLEVIAKSMQISARQVQDTRAQQKLTEALAKAQTAEEITRVVTDDTVQALFDFEGDAAGLDETEVDRWINASEVESGDMDLDDEIARTIKRAREQGQAGGI